MGVRATELRKGTVLKKDNDLLLITDYTHLTPGKGQAIIHIKTKSLLTGTTGAIRSGSGDLCFWSVQPMFHALNSALVISHRC